MIVAMRTRHGAADKHYVSKTVAQRSIEEAVSYTRDRLCAAQVDQDTIDSVVLCIIEAVGNALKHAADRDQAPLFDLSISVDDDKVTAHVTDYGPGFALRPRQMPDPLSEGGRGIPLMQSLCDVVRYERGRGCNRLTLHKKVACAAA